MSWKEPVKLAPPHEFVVIAAVRYARGRATYIVQEVCEFVAANWHLLSDNTKHVVHRDVREEVELRQALGDEQPTIHRIDNPFWEALLDKVEQEERA